MLKPKSGEKVVTGVVTKGKKKPPRGGASLRHSFYRVILAGAQGLEPGTYGFGDRRSTN